ncbi:MAG: hypothetical protein RL263_1300 [Bacteroidota bacterium]|jgi:hypothetical protein
MEPQNIFYLGMVIMIVSSMGSRLVKEKGLKNLSNEEKGKLVSAFAKTRVNNIVLLLGIVLVYMAIMFFEQSGTDLGFNPHLAYFIVLAGYVIFNYYITFKKLAEMNAPAEYVKHTKISTLISGVGFAAFLAAMIFYMGL